MASGSKLAVGSAIIGNFLVTIAKIVGFVLTGSGAMLAEVVHSIADTLNQVLLMIGIVRSARLPTQRFPFGFGPERYVWALMSAVGIFFLGCGVTIYHGVLTLMHPKPLENLGIAIGVLILSLLIEGTILGIALKTMIKAAAGKPLLAFLKNEADPSAVAVILEDTAACIGVLIAMSGIGLVRLTGQAYWDGLGSIAIGLLLGCVASWLILRNRNLLVGPAIPKEVRDEVGRLLEANPLIEKIAVMRSRTLDTETWRFSAEVEFAGEVLAEAMEEQLRKAWEEEIDDWESFRAFSARYADQVVELLGDEVDRIEDQIRERFPRIRYLDIEAD